MWSLTVEEMFYFFAPLSFFLIKTRKFFLLQVPVLLSIGALLVLLFSQFPLDGFFANFPFMFSTTFFGRCFEFFVGIFIALLLINQKIMTKKNRNYTLYGGLLFCFLLVITTVYAFANNVEFTNKTTIGLVLLNVFFPVAIGMFYLGLITEESFIKKILGAKWIVLLGKSSYAFYLIHFGMVAEVILFHLSSNVLVLFIALQLLSVLLYKFFEKPVYFFMLKKFGVKTSQV